MTDALELDAVIFGGGAAGLWMLDEFIRAGRRCLLLEAGELGAGQTIASQGIIHGGLKYTLSGLFSSSARAIADMPRIWRQCLAGEAKPNLSSTRLRAHSCVLAYLRFFGVWLIQLPLMVYVSVAALGGTTRGTFMALLSDPF